MKFNFISQDKLNKSQDQLNKSQDQLNKSQDKLNKSQDKLNRNIIFDNNKIFIGVPAFNEHFTHITIQDAYEKAKNPSNIYFGIFNQKTDAKTFENFSSYKNVRCVNAHYDKPLGAGLARLIASTLHDDEKYFLQIDAHSIFAKHWDSVLIEELDLLLHHVEKPLISQTCNWHDVTVYSDPERGFIKNFSGAVAYPFFPNQQGKPITNVDKTRVNEEKFLGKFLEHYMCSGGAGLFSTAHFIYEISYNPFIAFHPEQEFTALRSCTRGYRFFSSEKNMISTLSKDPLTGFDDIKYKDDRKFSYEEYNCDKLDMIKYLYGKKFGFYGAPDYNSYDDYVKKSKIDFENSSMFKD